MREVDTDQWIEEVSERALSVFQRSLGWQQIETNRVLYLGNCSIAMANVTPDVRVQRQLLTNSSVAPDRHSLIVGGKIYQGEDRVIGFHFGIYCRDVPEIPCKNNGRFSDSRLEDPRLLNNPLESYQYGNPGVKLYDYATGRLASISSYSTVRPWTEADKSFVEGVLDTLAAQRVVGGLQCIRDQLVPFLFSISTWS